MATKVDNDNIIKRVYQSIKERVVAYEFPAGERINIEPLAEELGVSTTPVRESLNRLVAEDLIQMTPKMGFFMKRPSESEIQDLYEFNQLLLTWSVDSGSAKCARERAGRYRCATALESLQANGETASARDLVKVTNTLFAMLATYSGNKEVALRVRSINDKLYYFRLCEKDVIPDVESQLLVLCQLYDYGRYEELIDGIKSYHKVRLKMIMDLCKPLRNTHSDEELSLGYESD